MQLETTIKIWQEEMREIGMAEFMPSSQVRDNFSQLIPETYIPIAVCECEALCLDITSGKIVLLAHEVANKVSCGVASNQSAFIASMTELDKHFEKCIDDEYADDTDIALNVRDICADIAGGDEYIPYFCSTLGV